MTNIAPHARNLNRTAEETKEVIAASPLGAKFADTPNEVTRWMATELGFVWKEFCQRLDGIPIIQKLESGDFTIEDYKVWLINLRQQVAEGGRWISQAAASMDQELFIVRSALIGHAAEEHQDFMLLEQSYVRLGGKAEDIQNRPRNLGSDAFTAYMFHESSKPNPLQLFGAMFIIEGLGQSKATRWGKMIQEKLKLEDKDIIFLKYHGENDEAHYEKLRMILSLPQITQEVAERVVKTARVVGRLYCLQLEELDNY